MTDTSSRRWLWVAAAFVLIGALTLVPHPEGVWPKQPWCWSCSANGDASDFILNVVLFVPLGVTLRRAGVGAVRTALLSIVTTVAIETLQYFVIAGRDSSIRDCVANALGGVVGFALAFQVDALWKPTRRQGVVLAWSAAALWIGHSIFAMFAFRPSMTARPLYVQITPDLSIYDVFDGRVGTATANDATLFSGPFPPGFTAEAWSDQPLELRITVKDGSATKRYAPILALVDDGPNEIASLGENKGELVFHSHTVGEALQLRPPVVSVAHVFPAPITAVVYGKREGWTLSAGVQTTANERRTVRIALRPAVGWMFWWPFDVPTSAVIGVVTALWLAIAFAAVGFWSAQGWRTQPRVLGPVLLASVAAHVVLPLAFRVDSLGDFKDAIYIAAGALFGLALGTLRKSGSEP